MHKVYYFLSSLSVSDRTLDAESNSLNCFMRGIKLFLTDKENRFVPNDNSTPLEWFSFMQHHGVRTRLLDTTCSPWIAAFFASVDISDTKEENGITKKRCIWAFPSKIIDAKNITFLGIKADDVDKAVYDYYQKNLGEINSPIIGYTFLEQLHERAFHQQSAFLYSMTSMFSFSRLLAKYYADDETRLEKLIFHFSDRNEFAKAIEYLRIMNITYSSLFPGIDGYGKEVSLYQDYFDKLQ